MVPHRESSASSSSASKGSRRGLRGVTSRKNVVFSESTASLSGSPRRGGRVRARPARVNNFYRGQEDSLQEEHWDGLNDQEVTVITPAPPAPPAPPGPQNSPLMDFHPPCVSRLSREGAQQWNQWNPEAPAWQPRGLDVGPWACGQLTSRQLPAAVWASTTWVEGPEFLGIGPLPSPGSGPVIPLYWPSSGPANPGWLHNYNSGAWGPSIC